MPSSRIPSPARSQGTKSTPRRHKPRVSRSVGSPARSNSSIKLTTMIQMNSFVLSPMPTRRSVLTDTTKIDIPRRNSWWKKLDENSREIMEVFSKDPAEANNAIEEYIEVDVLSQEKEKKQYTLDMPESSDNESISSIVIPQRKLFTQKESKPQKKFAQIIDNRESLATLHKTQGDIDKTLNVGRKNLFNKGTKQRTKPLFPSGLLNISGNKTIANKTKELVANDGKTQVKSLFGNRPGTKRKNMFADFMVSDSEDEIPEIQPKVFEFQKKVEEKRRQNLNSRDSREPRLTSPTSSVTDIEMDDWRLLPSSTMVDHQLEDGLRNTPSKRARLGKLSEIQQSHNTENNISSSKTKKSNKSINSKSKSRNLSTFKEMEVNDLTDNLESGPVKDTKKLPKDISTKNKSHDQQKDHSKSQNLSGLQTVSRVGSTSIDISEKKKAENNRKHNSKTLSKIDQVLESDDDEDFTLVYENDDDEVENAGNNIIVTEATDLKNISNITNVPVNTSATNHLQNKSQSHTLTSRNQANIRNTMNLAETHENGHKNIHSSIRNLSFRTQDVDKLQNNEMEIKTISTVDNIENNKQNTSQYKVADCEKEQLQDSINNHDKSDRREARQEHNSLNTEVSNKEGDDDSNNSSKQKSQHVDGEEELVSESADADDEVLQENHATTEVEDKDNTNDDEQNDSQEEENISEEDIEEDIEHHEEEEIEDQESIDNRENEEFNHDANVEEEEDTDVEMEQSKNIKHNEVNSEIRNNKNENQQDKEKTQNERNITQVDENQCFQDKGDDNNYTNRNISNRQHLNEDDKVNEIPKNLEANVTHDTTGRYRQKHDVKVASPEVILHGKPSLEESFSVQGRNTSVRKTKSIIKNQTIRPSLAPVRESTGFSDGSRNSSVEKSGWDSHRTTRATLRQTFGKDFTPRKSLRALVMEKSAKRQTSFYKKNADVSRFPQANSTELPGSEPFALDDFEIEEKTNTTGHVVSREKSITQKIDKSYDKQQLNKSNEEQELNKSNQTVSCNIDNSDGVHKNNENDCAPDNNTSNEEVSQGNDECNDVPKHSEFDHEALQDNDDEEPAEEISEADDAQEMNESDNEVSRENYQADEEKELDDPQEVYKSDDSQDIYESQDAEEKEDSDIALDINDSGDEEEKQNSDVSEDLNESENAEDNENSDVTEDINESENEEEKEDSDVAPEINESNNAQETEESDNEQEVDDCDTAQEVDENDDECEDAQETDVSADAQDMDESAQDREEFQDAQENIMSDHEVSSYRDTTDVRDEESNYEESRKSRQTTLEMYLQKVKKQYIERKKQLEEQVMNSLKAPARDVLNPFKVPAVPKQRRGKVQPKKAKPVKSSVIPTNMLPLEVIEDMKYKPPKRYRPTNASWITKRLYNFLETKLEPKYDYKARVRSEKLVETIYNFTKEIRRHSTAPNEAVGALKHEMARLEVVKTHFEFYEFFHEYMPREVRVKVVPDVFNKIPLPKHGVFSDILR